MGVALGIGRGKQFRNRLDIYTIFSNKASAAFSDAGFTLLSKKCERSLIMQSYDPAQTYFYYSKARSVFDAAGYTEISQSCSESLIQQIYGY